MVTEPHDVAIIGAGAVGAALARELSRYRLRILILEAGDDVAGGATRANSGIVHGGYTAKAGTRKAEFALPGNRLFSRLSAELDFPFRRCGSVVLGFDDLDLDALDSLLRNGEANGVEDLELLGPGETVDRVPRLNAAEVAGGLFCPGTGIVSPYEYAIALTENALANGAHLRLGSPVDGLERVGDNLALSAGGREYRARFAVNAAGAASAEVAQLAGPAPFRINPSKGQYIVFRRGGCAGLDTVVFQTPTKLGKGILVTPTVWDNLLVGPDAREAPDPEDLGTDARSLARIVRIASRSVADLKLTEAIRVFSGIRPVPDRGDFIIEWSEFLPGFLHLGGIESPGLTASPAIALEARRMLKEAGLPLKADNTFVPNRRAPVHPGPLGPAAAAARAANLPPGDPARIICRCEQVKESAVLDALAGPVPIRSLDAVKRRTRAGMGACQGAFCGPRVRELVASSAGLREDDVAGPSRDRSETRAVLERVRRLLSESP